MTPAQMREYFQNRPLGLYGTVGEYAVLVPLVERAGRLHLLFETRAETLVGHQPGEVCFPGGRLEPGEKPQQAALRETWEELGIPPETVDVLAPLDPIQDISDRLIHPFLALVQPEAAEQLKPNPDEVKNAFFVPLDVLLSYPEEVYRYPVQVRETQNFPFPRLGFPQDYPWRGGWMEVPIYEYEGHAIWGLTARLVRWFLSQLKCMQQEPLTPASNQTACAPGKTAGSVRAAVKTDGTSVEYLGAYQLTQSDRYFKLGRDSVLLASFCTLRPRWQVCDLGCGVGPLLLLLSQREEKLSRTGIEREPGAAALARQNLADNGLSGTILTGDLRDKRLVTGDRFHLVISNPPYFRAGSGASGGPARMDEHCSVEELCQAAGRLTRTGGRFALVYRPERLAELMAALEKARLTPKRMQLLAYDREKPPYALLLEAVKEGGPGLDILPTHYQVE